MEILASILIIIVGLVGVLFATVVGSTFFGGLAGWFVGLFFAEPILRIAGQFGIHDVTTFQLGLFLGFVGGFFRAVVSNPSKSKS